MTKEEKQLILKDLCARLPYRPYVLEFWKFKDEKDFREFSTPAKLGVNLLANIHQWANNDGITDRMYKPLLLPLSSMKEEQRSMLENWDMNEPMLDISGERQIYIATNPRILDWFNTHHFDYRGLIEQGLAIDATKLNIYKL